MSPPDHPIGRRIVGGVCYITHLFPEVGHVLEIHNHRDRLDQLHTTLIAKGRFVLMGAREGQAVEAGDLIAWAADEDHGLRCCEPGSIAVNIRQALPGETERALS